MYNSREAQLRTADTCGGHWQQLNTLREEQKVRLQPQIYMFTTEFRDNSQRIKSVKYFFNKTTTNRPQLHDVKEHEI